MKHRFSYSQLGTFEQCPLSWKLSRIDKVQQRTAGWFHQGTAAHSAIEAYLKGTNMPIEDIFDAEYDTLINNYSETHQEDYLWIRGRGPVVDDLIRRRNLGRSQVIAFKEWWESSHFEVMRVDNELAIETKVWWADKRWDVVGYVDAMIVDKTTGDKIIVDFKTGKTRQDGRQLALYKSIMEIDQTRKYDCAYIYLEESKVQYVPVDVSMWDLGYFEDQFNNLADQIEEMSITGNWVASPPKPCFTCTVAHHCEEKE